MYRSILVPLDGSAFGEHALPFGLSLARRAGAQLHLAHVHVAPAPILADANAAELRAAERMYLDGLVRRIGTCRSPRCCWMGRLPRRSMSTPWRASPI